MTRISILIPVYNDDCTKLVSCLRKIADATSGLVYEIVVAEDGSNDEETIQQNSHILQIPHCRYVKRDNNVGRAAIRNILAKEAKYEWLLFLDCDVYIPNKDFLSNYIKVASPNQVVYGGLSISGNSNELKNNLRYKYEKRSEPRQCASMRNKHPYQSFRTTNFFVERAIMIAHPFNEHIKTYGYEDVMFGKTMHENGIHVFHIDNQVHYIHYESNAAYLSKIEEAMHTLHQFKKDLAEYSSLITLQKRLHSCHLDMLLDGMFRLMRKWWRRNILSSHPSLALFNIYRLGLYNYICRHQSLK